MARLLTSYSAPLPLKAALYSPCGSIMTICPCGARSHILCRISAAEVDLPVPVDPSSAKRSEEHTSELQSLMRISYAVFCLKKKNHKPGLGLSSRSLEQTLVQYYSP